MTKTIIMIDFDGTITKQDLAFQILDKFSDDDWKYYDFQYERGEITLFECMRRQYNTIKGNLEILTSYIREVVEFRRGFSDFILQCDKLGWVTTILSAGLDFAIDYCMELQNIDIPIIAAKTHFVNGFITVDETGLEVGNDNIDFKALTIQEYKSKGFQVIMIGDGSTDKQAASKADLTCAVQNSSLEKYCIDKSINHVSFQEFGELANLILDRLSHNS